jgi:hypothetical protein
MRDTVKLALADGKILRRKELEESENLMENYLLEKKTLGKTSLINFHSTDFMKRSQF